MKWINKLPYNKGLLGSSSPESILNTLWLNNSLHFGLRVIKEHHNMCWGDVKLCKTDQGIEYLNFKQHQTWTGADHCDVRPFAPKLFLTDRKEKDPVAVYKLLLRKDRRKMKGPDDPFYIAVNNVGMKSKSSDKCWLKCNAVGINKLGSLMKEISVKESGSSERLTPQSTVTSAQNNKCISQIYWQTFLVSVQALLYSVRLQLHQLQLNLDKKEPVTTVTLPSGLWLYSRVKSFVEKSSQ